MNPIMGLVMGHLSLSSYDLVLLWVILDYGNPNVVMLFESWEA